MKFFIEILKVLLILVFPFVLLIRSAVEMHSQYQLSPYLCIAFSIALASILIFFYLTVAYSHFSGRLGSFDGFKKRWYLSLLIVSAFVFKGLFSISELNLQDQEMANEINKVHPILRLSLSTILVIDKSLIVTDGSRRPDDYRKMGLPINPNSLHYIQNSGFAHAIDIRTRNRSTFQNIMTEKYFSLMGFNTMRHSGTQDHLHVSLMAHKHPHKK